MFLSYITTASLDILWGVTYWVIQKTGYGVKRLLYTPHHESMTRQYDRNLLLKLETETSNQKKELLLLNKKIQIMNDYIQRVELIKR
tara:strand:+ start:52 stop:312 length:261 start_codon:yes stop_codon:yes gene_type:complete